MQEGIDSLGRKIYFSRQRKKTLSAEKKNSLGREKNTVSLRRIPLAHILAAHGQLVVLQRGQHLLELHEEAFAWSVAVGIHVERCAEPLLQPLKHQLVVVAQKRGRWYGYRLVSGREHSPAVACALGDVEWLPGAQHGRDGQVVDGAA